MTRSINPDGLLNTPIIVPPHHSTDIELDFLIYESESLLRKCATEYKISWMDEEYNAHIIEEVFDTPTCQAERFVRYNPVNSSKDGEFTLY